MIDFGPGSQTRRVAVGLDLGHANDYSALTVIEQRQHYWILRAAHRFPLGTPFGAIVETLRRMARHPDLRGRASLIVDSTGLGAPVVEMIRRARVEMALHPVVITGGATASSNGSIHRVPKRDLVTALYLMFESGALQIPRTLPAWKQLEEELLRFQARIAPSGETSYEASSPDVHDDLVVSLALAAWFARPRGTIGPRSDGPLL